MDPRTGEYVLIAGHAQLSNDRAKIAELWTKFDEAWWKDVNDPTIRLLTVSPVRGSFGTALARQSP